MLLDRVQARVGGPAALELRSEAQYPAGVVRWFPALTLAISPLRLFGLVNRGLVPLAYANLHVRETVVSERRMNVRIEIPANDRPCPAFFHATAGAMRGAPTILGYPLAVVEMTTTPRVGDFAIVLPASRTLPARARRVTRDLLSNIAAQEVEETWQDARSLRDQLVSAEVSLDTRVAQASARWGLTPRQREVLAELAIGRSAKEIGERLGCAIHTAELHASAILKRAGVDSRSALIARLWEAR
ncbi:MAG: response regulator transcription factor [Polyangiales bacterium]